MTNLETMTKENIEKEIKSMEQMGFLYLQQWQMEFHTPDRFKTPSGKILDENELLSFFDKTNPQIANKDHLEITNTLH